MNETDLVMWLLVQAWRLVGRLTVLLVDATRSLWSSGLSMPTTLAYSA